MPTYEFRCPSNHRFEQFWRKISDAPATVDCPTCGKPAERQVSGGAGLLFKGSGFYITDYGKDGKKDQRTAASKATNSAESGAASTTSAEQSSSSGSGDSSTAKTDSTSSAAKSETSTKSSDSGTGGGKSSGSGGGAKSE